MPLLDEKAIEEVYQHVLSRARQMCRRSRAHQDDGEDVAHDTMVRLLAAMRDGIVSNPLHYARVTAAHVFLDLVRQGTGRFSYEELAMAPPTFLPVTRGPEGLTLDRQFLLLIDDHFNEHIENGVSGEKGYRLDRNCKRKIQRRAEALSREGRRC